MRYWKRVDGLGNTTTVESYSHDLDIAGAVEITQAEFNVYLEQLKTSPEAIAAQAKEQKRQNAQARAIQAIKDNAGNAPWGRILNDIAIAQDWIE